MSERYFINCVFVLLALSGLLNSNSLKSPSCRLVSPTSYTVFTNNSIALKALVSNNMSGNKSVKFFYSYVGFTLPSEEEVQFPWPDRQVLIGVVNKPPYEIVWDCSQIPDQDQWRLNFFCTIEDEERNTFNSNVVTGVVIDRKSEFSKSLLRSQYTGSSVTIDGDLSEWSKTDDITFVNNDNTIISRSIWNEQELCFAIIVNDANLQCPTNVAFPFVMYDCVSLFFDVKMDRSSLRKEDDIQVDIGVYDTAHGNVIFVDHDTLINYSFPKENYKFAVKRFGTLNDDHMDSGYVIEIAFQWEKLGHDPNNYDTLGFDIFNSDNDFKKAWRIGKGLSGTEIPNNNNPSEWASLVLLGKNNSSRMIYVFIFIVIFVLIAVGVRYLKMVNIEPEPKVMEVDTRKTKTSAEFLIERLREYLESNYTRQDLSLEIAAGDLKISSGYISKTLKIVEKCGFSQLLAQMRIDKSKNMLTTEREKNISQIAYACGFNSSEYFIKTFKKLSAGQTPSEYRRLS